MRTFRSSVISLALVLAAAPAASQPGGSTVTLSPGFSPDPQTISGTAGGPNSASVHGSGPTGSCLGYIPQAPQHVVTLTEHFDQLHMAVSSSADTTLVIQGPVGWWCNDDELGLNPGMSGQWAPGTYQLYVGTYQMGENAPYTLTISQSTGTDPSAQATPPAATPPAYPITPPTPVSPLPPVATPPPVAASPPVPPPPVAPPPSGGPVAVLDSASPSATNGDIQLTTGFLPDPQILNGRSGGGVHAASLGVTATGPCQGFADRTPNHIMTLNTPFNYLRVDVSSAGDTTLIVHGPNGWWCNDDTMGLNPRVVGAWAPGTYRIWVGSYQGGQSFDYHIAFSEWTQ